MEDVGDTFASMAICQDINENVQAEDTAENELGDSGATSHITNSDFYIMINNKIYELPVTIVLVE